MARSFAGGTDKIDFGDINALDGLSALTISYWVTPNATPSSYPFHFSKIATGGGDGWCTFQDQQLARIATAFRNSGQSSTNYWLGTNGGFTLGVLHHIAMVYNGAGATNALKHRLFLDGVEDTGGTFSEDMPTSLGANSEPVLLGGYGTSTLDSLSEAAAWDAVLSDAEVAALYKGFSPQLIRPASLKFYAPITGRNSPEIDRRGGALGTLTGTAYVNHPRVIMPKRRQISFPGTAVSAAITGTATASITEADVVAGGKTIIITLTGDTWIAAGALDFDLQRDEILQGLDSAQSELLGWNTVVRDLESVAAVVRTSNTVVTITLSAAATYNITAQETITVTVPSTAVAGGVAIAATPTFTVDIVAGAIASLANALMMMGHGR